MVDEEELSGPGARKPIESPATTRAWASDAGAMAAVEARLGVRVVDDLGLLELMGETARVAVTLWAGADYAGVTVVLGGQLATVAHTNLRVLVVDEGQYATGDGPCLRALRTGTQVAMTGPDVDRELPGLAAAARAVGVRSFLAAPVHVRSRSRGSLNLYSGAEGGVLGVDPDLLAVLGEYLGRGLADHADADAGAGDDLDRAAALVTTILWDTAVRQQAVGVLMATHQVDAAAAQQLLDDHATRTGQSAAQAAAAVILELTGHRPAPRPD